ncbi:hypothetical protein VNO77_19060 [Canavalia gladiata]|uniref:Uncharacterized protein n=1 Tax=Canavalia gladiata TaxID=3824 RepID=A0AAN9QI71_CANGL
MAFQKKGRSQRIEGALLFLAICKAGRGFRTPKAIQLQHKPILSASDSRKAPKCTSRLSVFDLNVCGKRPKSYCIADDVRFVYATISFIVQWLGVRYPDSLV